MKLAATGTAHLFFQAFDDLADDPDRDEVIWYEYRDRRIGY